MSFISALATKASSYIGLAISFLGTGLAAAAHYAPFILPVLSPSAQLKVGAVLAVVGQVQLFLSKSALPAVNAVAAPAVPAATVSATSVASKPE